MRQGFQYCRPRIWRQGRNDGNGGAGYFGSDIGNSTGGNFSISPEFADVLMALESDDRQENILAGQIYMFDPTTYAKTSTPYKYKDEEICLDKTIRLKWVDAEGDPHYVEYEDGIKNTSLYPADCAMLNTGKDVKGWSQGYKSVKYFVIREDFINGRNQSNDLPIFRYADILLTHTTADRTPIVGIRPTRLRWKKVITVVLIEIPTCVITRLSRLMETMMSLLTRCINSV